MEKKGGSNCICGIQPPVLNVDLSMFQIPGDLIPKWSGSLNVILQLINYLYYDI